MFFSQLCNKIKKINDEPINALKISRNNKKCLLYSREFFGLQNPSCSENPSMLNEKYRKSGIPIMYSYLQEFYVLI